MVSLRYLNGILTVIAVLLSVHTWAMLAGTSPTSTSPTTWVTETQAASRKAPSGGGIPDAGAQRRQTVDMLKRLSQQTESLTNLFRTGQARVRVEGAK